MPAATLARVIASTRRVWREVDGERIEGTWRHAFVCNAGRYHLTDLFIYADGLVDCWGLVTLDEFEEKLASGWVATELPDGAEASAHRVGAWKFAEPRAALTADMLLGEVLDVVDQLNRRPDSTARCLAALVVFLDQPDEANRAALRAAYNAIPEHKRAYALGDMDRKDWPLRVLTAGPGNRYTWYGEEEVVTDDAHTSALDYFADRAERRRRYAEEQPQEPAETSIPIDKVTFPNGWPEDAGILVLRNEFPAPVTVGTRTHPSVADAYEAVAGTVAPQARTAVMAALLRLKFAQHPGLAATLTATGTSRLIYTDHSTFWGHGRNWMGRLLELVRAELAVHNQEPFTTMNPVPG
jgi:hypothetical protein